MVTREYKPLGYLMVFFIVVIVSLLLDFIDTNEVRIVSSVLQGIIVALLIFLAELLQKKKK